MPGRWRYVRYAGLEVLLSHAEAAPVPAAAGLKPPPRRWWKDPVWVLSAAFCGGVVCVSLAVVLWPRYKSWRESPGVVRVMATPVARHRQQPTQRCR